MNDRYALIVVNRRTGDPTRLGEFSDSDVAHEQAATWNERGNYTALVVGLRP